MKEDKMKKRILITGGRMKTVVKIDEVRTMTIENQASGKTAVRMAKYFAKEGWQVTVILFVDVDAKELAEYESENVVRVERYQSYQELFGAMETEVCSGDYDAVAHSSAVSDYILEAVYVTDDTGEMVPAQEGGKLSSRHEAIFCKLVPTEKILAKIKNEWEFEGVVVGFKLESDISSEELVQRAYKKISGGVADIMIANLQKWAKDYFYLVTETNSEEVSGLKARRNLYRFLFREVEEEVG
jgi:phosphopantothenoylcysteine synthetase/decarboxylase